jgi:hypothetical protein
MGLKAVPKPLRDFRRGMNTARVLRQLGLNQGLSPEGLLRKTGLSQTDTDAPLDEIDAAQEIQLVRKLTRGLPHLRTLGLEAGSHYRVTADGLWGCPVMSSSTLGKGMGMGMGTVISMT